MGSSTNSVNVAAEPGIGTRLLAVSQNPNLHAVNLSVSFMMIVALVLFSGWLVLSTNKIDALEAALEKSRLEFQAVKQLQSTRTVETGRLLDGLQDLLSALDKRTKTIEGRLNIGTRDGNDGVKPTATGASGQATPETRRIIRDDGSLVIKTPLVE